MCDLYELIGQTLGSVDNPVDNKVPGVVKAFATLTVVTMSLTVDAGVWSVAIEEGVQQLSNEYHVAGVHASAFLFF